MEYKSLKLTFMQSPSLIINTSKSLVLGTQTTNQSTQAPTPKGAMSINGNPSASASANGSRHTANFPPSVWGDYFLSSYASHTTMKEYYELEKQVEELKVEVRSTLVAPVNNLSEKLKLIDSIQLLGVSYHFKTEIDELLEQIYNNINDHSKNGSHEQEGDLNMTALQFRLLRQQGYNISSDIFRRFYKNGDFTESLTQDVRGLLSLYEAANMRVHGENILDEALDFTTTHLEANVGHLSPPLAIEVNHSLIRPIRKGLVRLRAKHYMSVYEEDPSHNHILLKFSKLNFNMLQKLHQKEISDMSRWWRDLKLKVDLTFARDRMVEAYFWSLQVYFEPQYSLARTMLAKVMAIDSVIDDVYDAYGTFEELQLLTEAIERWDINAIQFLPNYMKLFYQAVLDSFEEIEEETKKKGRQYAIFYAKKSFKEQIRAYIAEAKWFKEGYTPSLEEYMENALESSGSRMLTINSLLGMDDLVTPEAYVWADKNPKIIQASAVICRLMDDIVSHKFEQERGHVVSAVECYMKQQNNLVSEEDTYDKFRKQVENSWKDMNEACLNPTEVPMEILVRVLNLARVIELLYKYEDGYTNNDGATKLYIKSLLVDSVPI